MLSFALASVRNVLADRKGVTALEYGVIAGGIIAVVAVGVTQLGGPLNAIFTGLLAKIQG